MNLVRPFFSPNQRDRIKIFGHDKNEWKSFLSKYVADDQLSFEFGGTRNSV